MCWRALLISTLLLIAGPATAERAAPDETPPTEPDPAAPADDAERADESPATEPLPGEDGEEDTAASEPAAPAEAAASTDVPSQAGVAGATLEPELVEIVRPTNREQRIAAVRTLTALAPQVALERLALVLRLDPDPEVRAWAARGLDELGSRAAQDVIRAALETEPERRVRQVLQAVELDPEPARPGALPLLLGGVFVALAYVPTVLAGIFELIKGGVDQDDEVIEIGWRLLIPVAGPAWALIGTETEEDAKIQAFGWSSVLLQAGGIAAVIAGLVLRGRAARRAEQGQRRTRLGLLPVGGPGGLALAGWFG